jgi:glycosyltransferase involved in cell wall biosynthesis
MRLLFLTQFYPPEVGATQNRVSDLAKRLVRAGHSVTVVTALPNYPEGRVFEGYRKRLWMEDASEGVRILRVWTYATNSVGVIRRLFSYLSYTLAATIMALLKGGDHELLYVESPPLFLGIAGILVSRCRKSRFLFNVTDLWPASAVALGILRNPAAIRFATWLEVFIYKHCNIITGQTEGIVDSIRAMDPGVPVTLVMNGVSPEAYVHGSAVRDQRRHDLGFSNSFVVGYAGRHGVAQGLDTVLRAAEIVSGQHDIQFAFFGDGPEKDKLLQFSERNRLQNVRFFSPRPAADMPEILSCFDAAVVPLKKLDLFRGALPCKLFECMAAGVPVIVAIEGEAKRLVEKANGGIPIVPEDPQAMADAITVLYANAELRNAMGLSGREYVLSRCSRQHAADMIEKLALRSILARPDVRPIADLD